MERITIYDSNHNPLSPSEITLGQIFEYEIVIIDDNVYKNTDTLSSLGNGDIMTLFGASSLKYYNTMSIDSLRDDFSTTIDDAKENEQFVVLLEDGIDTKFPYICANGLIHRNTFWNIVKILNELRESSDFLN